jgi:hypothetical protein
MLPRHAPAADVAPRRAAKIEQAPVIAWKPARH